MAFPSFTSAAFFALLLVFSGCSKDPFFPVLKTENVVVIVIDGPRYSETWGDPTHQYIPELAGRAPSGTIATDFRNEGETLTTSGHTAITTGVHQSINNNGQEFPAKHSFFQEWLKTSGCSSEKAWIITSKDKLEVLSDCLETGWSGQFKPRTDCGNSGIGSGYRDDSTTLKHAIDTMSRYKPNIILIQFKEPDASGHSGVWQEYINGIVSTDRYLKSLFTFFDTSAHYKNKTSIFVTNDHGRHLDGVSSGFSGHGDNCMGCRKINFFAYGPDFKKGNMVNKTYSQVDLSKTIAEILRLKMEHSSGRKMDEIFTEDSF